MPLMALDQPHGTADSSRQPDIGPLEEKGKQCYWNTKIQSKNTENDRNSDQIPVIVFVQVYSSMSSG